MALIGRTTASFDAIKPVPDLVKLDNEFNQLVGANGILNGGSTSNRQLTKYNHATEPVIECDQLGAGLIAQFKQSGVEKARIENDGDLVSNGITTAAGVVTFGSIPVGPAADCTTANQYARKAYVDNRVVSFSVGFLISDPSTVTVNNRDFGSFIVPAGGTYTFTQGKIMFRSGSHTPGGSLVFKIEQVGVGDKSSLGLNDS